MSFKANPFTGEFDYFEQSASITKATPEDYIQAVRTVGGIKKWVAVPAKAVGGVQWLWSATDPTPDMGGEGDWCLQVTSSDVWRKDADGWHKRGNLKGSGIDAQSIRGKNIPVPDWTKIEGYCLTFRSDQMVFEPKSSMDVNTGLNFGIVAVDATGKIAKRSGIIEFGAGMPSRFWAQRTILGTIRDTGANEYSETGVENSATATRLMSRWIKDERTNYAMTVLSVDSGEHSTTMDRVYPADGAYGARVMALKQSISPATSTVMATKSEEKGTEKWSSSTILGSFSNFGELGVTHSYSDTADRTKNTLHFFEVYVTKDGTRLELTDTLSTIDKPRNKGVLTFTDGKLLLNGSVMSGITSFAYDNQGNPCNQAVHDIAVGASNVEQLKWVNLVSAGQCKHSLVIPYYTPETPDNHYEYGMIDERLRKQIITGLGSDITEAYYHSSVVHGGESGTLLDASGFEYVWQPYPVAGIYDLVADGEFVGTSGNIFIDMYIDGVKQDGYTMTIHPSTPYQLRDFSKAFKQIQNGTKVSFRYVCEASLDSAMIRLTVRTLIKEI